MHTFRYQVFRRLHCWLALPFALFLIIQGLTGTAITWKHELDVWLNSDLMLVPVPAKKVQVIPQKMALSVVLDRFKSDQHYANPAMIELPEKSNEVLIAWYKSGKPQAGNNDKRSNRQVMINPYTGDIVGERIVGENGFSRSQLMSTLLSLHRQLLSGDNGKLVVAINGVVLAIIALSGIYLWWPVWRLKAWWQAITISRHGSWKRFNFRLHRAAGFYAAPFFLMLAITGIYFNRPEWITPLVAQLTVVSPDGVEIKTTPTILVENNIKNVNLEQAIDLAQQQFPLARVSRISLPEKANGKYEIRLHQPGELRQGSGATRVTVDAESGTISKIRDPLKASKEVLFYSYFFPLHSGEIFGAASKIVVSIVGLLPLLFAISGTLIWWRRR